MTIFSIRSAVHRSEKRVFGHPEVHRSPFRPSPCPRSVEVGERQPETFRLRHHQGSRGLAVGRNGHDERRGKPKINLT